MDVAEEPPKALRAGKFEEQHLRLRLNLRDALFLSYCLFSGVTWVAGSNAAQVSGRLTAADIIGVALIGLFVFRTLWMKGMKIALPTLYAAYLPLLFVLLMGVAFSARPELGLFEFLIHVFTFVLSLAIFNLYAERDAGGTAGLLLNAVLYCGGLLAGLALLGFLAIPELFDNASGGLVGTFRNTGQAGSFFGLSLALVIPAFLCGLLRASRLNLMCCICLVLALVLTGKRAALIGVCLGFVLLIALALLAGSRSERKYSIFAMAAMAILLPLGYLIFQWALENIDGMSARFSSKFAAESVEGFSDGFLQENIRATLSALTLNPFFGVGLGNVAGSITEEYEIHSTYMAVLGTAGLVGALAYGFYTLLYLFQLSRAKATTIYGAYLRMFFPMLIGLYVSWAYTYHLRKREFWTMFAITTLIAHFHRREVARAVQAGG